MRWRIWPNRWRSKFRWLRQTSANPPGHLTHLISDAYDSRLTFASARTMVGAMQFGNLDGQEEVRSFQETFGNSPAGAAAHGFAYPTGWPQRGRGHCPGHRR